MALVQSNETRQKEEKRDKRITSYKLNGKSQMEACCNFSWPSHHAVIWASREIASGVGGSLLLHQFGLNDGGTISLFISSGYFLYFVSSILTFIFFVVIPSTKKQFHTLLELSFAVNLCLVKSLMVNESEIIPDR